MTDPEIQVLDLLHDQVKQCEDLFTKLQAEKKKVHSLQLLLEHTNDCLYRLLAE
jgi:hypothetical protein